MSAWSEMEPAVATAMRSVEVLRPYARKPYTTLVLYGGMSVPLVLFLIPAMLAIGMRPPLMWQDRVAEGLDACEDRAPHLNAYT